mmetsp:Transcript_31693/g.101572  ORF Transcript_31693/g.101572 Transcript_31693/m.101572 type:complete len:201 (+) Transcript_31693:174-776(+)
MMVAFGAFVVVDIGPVEVVRWRWFFVEEEVLPFGLGGWVEDVEGFVVLVGEDEAGGGVGFDFDEEGVGVGGADAVFGFSDFRFKEGHDVTGVEGEEAIEAPCAVFRREVLLVVGVVDEGVYFGLVARFEGLGEDVGVEVDFAFVGKGVRSDDDGLDGVDVFDGRSFPEDALDILEDGFVDGGSDEILAVQRGEGRPDGRQ